MGGSHVHALYSHGDSRVHALPPQVKVVATLAFVVAVVATPREAWWAFALFAGLAVGVVRAARLRPGFVATRLVVLVPFLVAAATLPFIAGGERWGWFSIDGLWGLWNVTAKATLGVVASVTLAATTEAADLVRGMERLRLPRIVTGIMGFMIRYVDIVVDEVTRMRIAMRSRGYRPRWLGQAGMIGRGIAGLFVRAFERGERIYRAMASRGYTGRLPAGDSAGADAVSWAAGLAVPAVAWAVAVTAIVAR